MKTVIPLPLLIPSTLLFGLAVMLATWYAWPREEDAWERIRRTGEIRIGYSLEAPYAFRDPQGRVTGEAPEVARELLGRLGVKHIEWVHAEFGTLIPQLRAGRFDIIAAGMYRTPSRLEQIDFSSPSFCVGPGFLVRHGNPLRIHDYTDLAGPTAARLAVLAGAIEEAYARRAGIPAARIVAFPDADSAARSVRSGLVDVLALSGPSVRMLALTDPTLEAVVPARTASPDTDPLGGCGAFGFRKRDGALRQAFNQELERYLGTPDHTRLVAGFGFIHANLPGAGQIPPPRAAPARGPS